MVICYSSPRTLTEAEQEETERKERNEKKGCHGDQGKAFKKDRWVNCIEFSMLSSKKLTE